MFKTTTLELRMLMAKPEAQFYNGQIFFPINCQNFLYHASNYSKPDVLAKYFEKRIDVICNGSGSEMETETLYRG